MVWRTGLDFFAEDEGEDAFEDEDGEEGGFGAEFDPEDRRRDCGDGQEESQPAGPGGNEVVGGGGPLGEGFGVDSDFEVFADYGHVFAEGEAGSEFGDGGLAFEDVRDGGGGEEPVGEGLFAHAGAGLREKFEEAGGAEEVEVGGVEVGGDVDRERLLAVADASGLRCGRCLCGRTLRLARPGRCLRRMREW